MKTDHKNLEDIHPGIVEMNESIEAYKRILFGPSVNSRNRLSEMIYLLREEGSDLQACVGWPVFHDTWTGCDDTWSLREELSELIEMLIGSGAPLDYLGKEDAAAYEALPKHIRIYRGCSIERIYGFAWTTDRDVAERFAGEQRFAEVPYPVVADLKIPKQMAIGFYTDREESEIMVNPRHFGGRVVQVRRL